MFPQTLYGHLEWHLFVHSSLRVNNVKVSEARSFPDRGLEWGWPWKSFLSNEFWYLESRDFYKRKSNCEKLKVNTCTFMWLTWSPWKAGIEAFLWLILKHRRQLWVESRSSGDASFISERSSDSEPRSVGNKAARTRNNVNEHSNKSSHYDYNDAERSEWWYIRGQQFQKSLVSIFFCLRIKACLRFPFRDSIQLLLCRAACVRRRSEENGKNGKTRSNLGAVSRLLLKPPPNLIFKQNFGANWIMN